MSGKTESERCGWSPTQPRSVQLKTLPRSDRVCDPNRPLAEKDTLLGRLQNDWLKFRVIFLPACIELGRPAMSARERTLLCALAVLVARGELVEMELPS